MRVCLLNEITKGPKMIFLDNKTIDKPTTKRNGRFSHVIRPMKYRCMCGYVITGDVYGSSQRLLNQYVYEGSSANHAPATIPPA